MADKQWCPACESCTSDLRESYENGWQCPYCGLSNAAWREILVIQAARDDDELAKKFTELRIENDKLKRDLKEANSKLDRLRASIKGALA